VHPASDGRTASLAMSFRVSLSKRMLGQCPRCARLRAFCSGETARLAGSNAERGAVVTSPAEVVVVSGDSLQGLNDFRGLGGQAAWTLGLVSTR
jgi:hypothetical protein